MCARRCVCVCAGVGSGRGLRGGRSPTRALRSTRPPLPPRGRPSRTCTLDYSVYVRVLLGSNLGTLGTVGYSGYTGYSQVCWVPCVGPSAAGTPPPSYVRVCLFASLCAVAPLVVPRAHERDRRGERVAKRALVGDRRSRKNKPTVGDRRSENKTTVGDRRSRNKPTNSRRRPPLRRQRAANRESAESKQTNRRVRKRTHRPSAPIRRISATPTAPPKASARSCTCARTAAAARSSRTHRCGRGGVSLDRYFRIRRTVFRDNADRCCRITRTVVAG